MQKYSFQILDRQGRRKYLTPHEFRYFVDATASLFPRQRVFCLVVAFTGCRISEALNLCLHHVEQGQVVLRTLKRRSIVHRVVQVPYWLTDAITALWRGADTMQRLWDVCRSTGYRWITRVMRIAQIVGIHASPKGLRHGFGARNVLAGVPLGKTQQWLGHSSIRSTAIYTDVVGAEERTLAEKTWAW